MPQGIQDNNVEKVDLIYTRRGRFLKSINSPLAKVTKFALSDDGVDYNLFNENLDEDEKAIRILRTPMLEAFTSDTALLKNKLISLQRDTTETSNMEVSPKAISFEVDPDSKTKEFVEAIIIRAGFPTPNGFVVSLDNAEYVYVNQPPSRRISNGGRGGGSDTPTGINREDGREDQLRVNDGRNLSPSLMFSSMIQPDQESGGMNSFMKGEKSQKIIVGKNNTAPNETVIRVYYSDRYKKFQEDTPVKTRLVVESIDGGYSKEIEIEIKKKQ